LRENHVDLGFQRVFREYYLYPFERQEKDREMYGEIRVPSSGVQFDAKKHSFSSLPDRPSVVQVLYRMPFALCYNIPFNFISETSGLLSGSRRGKANSGMLFLFQAQCYGESRGYARSSTRKMDNTIEMKRTI